MAADWKTVPFSHLAELVRDTVHPAEAGNVVYVGLEHIGERTLQLIGHGVASDATSVKTRFREGDILFGKLRPYFRKVVRAPFDGICSTDIWVVRPREGVDAGYLFYLMASDLFVEPLVRASEGTRMPRAKWEYAASLQLPLPPPPEQRAIARILGTLNDKIVLNRRMAQTLEEMARALLKAWFVDFEPVRAKMDGRWRRGESLLGLPADLYDLFPDRLVDSELGPIPEGWELRPLGSLVRTVKGHSYKSTELQESDTALVTLKSFARGGGYRPDGLKPFTGDCKPEQVVAPGEVVVACTDVTQAAEVIGCPAMVRPSSKYSRLVASLDTLILRALDQRLTPAFIYLLCRTDAFREHAYAHTTGTTVLHLAREAVPSFLVVLPPESVMKTFNQTASCLLARVQHVELEVEELVELRDTLLPKLISGELRLRDAERFLEETEA